LVSADSVFYPTRSDTGTSATRQLVRDSSPESYEPLAAAHLRMLKIVEAAWFQQRSGSP
jgi:hypothetical protein